MNKSENVEQHERNAVNNKKRHIGNDYIVIRPSGEQYYSIEVKTKEELEEVGLFPSFQICHEQYLALIVRDMALSYDLTCKVYHGQGLDYRDNKSERLNQILRIRERLVSGVHLKRR